MNRYANQISLSTIGTEGQTTLNRSSVLVIGAGGLGCPALSYLAGTGIGRIGIVDGDLVTIENLHRQILFDENDVDQPKSNIAKKKLKQKNSEVIIKSHPVFLNAKNAVEIISQYDLILDCTDDTKARYLINDICMQQEKTWVFGALHQYEGQLAVFNHRNSGSYRCLFPESLDIHEASSCEQAGIFPTLAGIIGVMQANEALKIILNIPEIMKNTLLIMDVRNWHIRKIGFTKRMEDSKSNKTLTKNNLSICIDDISEKHQLIDIRIFQEREESQVSNLLQIDSSLVQDYINNNASDKTYVIVCKSGKRSFVMAHKLNSEGLSNVKSLNGGITVLERQKTKTENQL